MGKQQSDKSQGELWDRLFARIDKIDEKLNIFDNKLQTLEGGLQIIQLAGKQKQLQCKHNMAGYCREWEIRSENAEKISIEVFRDTGGKLRVRSSPLWCGICPLFERTEEN